LGWGYIQNSVKYHMISCELCGIVQLLKYQELKQVYSVMKQPPRLPRFIVISFANLLVPVVIWVYHFQATLRTNTLNHLWHVRQLIFYLEQIICFHHQVTAIISIPIAFFSLGLAPSNSLRFCDTEQFYIK
jgi:hypothetical protein